MKRHSFSTFCIRSLLLSAMVIFGVPFAWAYEQATVVDVTTVSVFIDKGLNNGLEVGGKVELFRDGKVVAVYEVTAVSSKRAVCDRGNGSVAVAPGDIVQFTAAKVAAATSAETANTAKKSPQKHHKTLAELGIRGRVGASYLAILQHTEGVGDYQQPSLDLRLDGTQVGGAPIDFNVDVRTRRTYRGLASGETRTNSQTRIYRASLAYARPGDPLRVTVGRQMAPSLAMVSLFDGALAEYRKPDYGAGIFGGTQPSIPSYGFSTDVREFGGYYEMTSLPAAKTRWALTTGAVSSQENGEINRDFVFLQGRLSGEHGSLFLSNEMDYNRGWRKEAEGSSFDLTSLYLYGQWRFNKYLTARGGFDNRRSVRLYRDVETPETDFDDAVRRGYWAGLDGNIGQHLSISADWRKSDVSGGDSADSQSGYITVRRLTKFDLEARLRSTHYTNGYTAGWLYSLAFSAQLAESLRLEIHGGYRNDTAKTTRYRDSATKWYGIEADYQFSRHWFMTLFVDRNSGDFESNDQIFVTQSYRF